jgi:hypothetical protein
MKSGKRGRYHYAQISRSRIVMSHMAIRTS